MAYEEFQTPAGDEELLYLLRKEPLDWLTWRRDWGLCDERGLSLYETDDGETVLIRDTDGRGSMIYILSENPKALRSRLAAAKNIEIIPRERKVV